MRGLENVHKKFLIQAAACNLALLMRSTYGSGKPRAAHDRAAEAILMILAVIEAVEDIYSSASAFSHSNNLVFRHPKTTIWFYSRSQTGISVAVGTTVTHRPPHRSVRCRIAAYGSYLGCIASKRTFGCGCRILALGIHRSTNDQEPLPDHPVALAPPP